MAKAFISTVIPEASDIDVQTQASLNSIYPQNITVQDVLNWVFPQSRSLKVAYLSNYDVDYVEFFSNSNQITANRIARVDVVYSGFNPTQEVWKFYDETDGTTVTKTVTIDHTFSGFDLQSSSMVAS